MNNEVDMRVVPQPKITWVKVRYRPLGYQLSLTDAVTKVSRWWRRIMTKRLHSIQYKMV